MIHDRKSFVMPLLLLALVVCPPSPLLAASHQGHQQEGHQHDMRGGEAMENPSAVFAAMPDPGEKVPIGNGEYLTYEFDKRPQMGVVILKVRIFGPNGKPDTSLDVFGDSGMPSMRGAHETGDQPFKLSRKGDYLLPVTIVMPGDWEIRLTVKKDGKVLFRGSHGFDV